MWFVCFVKDFSGDYDWNVLMEIEPTAYPLPCTRCHARISDNWEPLFPNVYRAYAHAIKLGSIIHLFENIYKHMYNKSSSVLTVLFANLIARNHSTRALQIRIQIHQTLLHFSRTLHLFGRTGTTKPRKIFLHFWPPGKLIKILKTWIILSKIITNENWHAIPSNYSRI